MPHAYHPVLSRHPRTGEEILYVSEQQTDHIESLDFEVRLLDLDLGFDDRLASLDRLLPRGLELGILFLLDLHQSLFQGFCTSIQGLFEAVVLVSHVGVL